MKHDTPNELLMRVLRRALSLQRPHGSVEEGSLLLSLAFDIGRYKPATPMFVDPAGNLHVDMRVFNKRGNTKNRTLFVAHVDTVHWRGGPNEFDDSGPIWKAKGAPLGADDGAGVAVLSALIRSGKAAYYIFTRGEEQGGIGSKYLADEMADILCEFDRAIAFDRKDVFSIITHQGFRGRCCSDDFAEALCTGLNDLGMMMMPDDGGVYTDTAEFVEIIPECTNISAGYYKEHGPQEHLDTEYLQQIAAAAIALDWDALPTARDPEAYEPDDRYWNSKYPPAVPTTGYAKAEAAAKAALSGAQVPAAEYAAEQHALRQAELDDAWGVGWDLTQAERDDLIARLDRDDKPGHRTYESFAEYDRAHPAKKPPPGTVIPISKPRVQGTLHLKKPQPVLLTKADKAATNDALHKDVAHDPFAWSDDGKTYHTGSGATRHPGSGRKDN